MYIHSYTQIVQLIEPICKPLFWPAGSVLLFIEIRILLVIAYTTALYSYRHKLWSFL